MDRGGIKPNTLKLIMKKATKARVNYAGGGCYHESKRSTGQTNAMHTCTEFVYAQIPRTCSKSEVKLSQVVLNFQIV